MRKFVRFDLQFLHSCCLRLNAVNTGENQPIVFRDPLESTIQRLVRTRRANLDERNFDYLRSQSSQRGRKRAGLLARSPNQHANPSQRLVYLARALHFTPKPRLRIKSATPEIAESVLAPRAWITFSCSAFVRFWLSLNFASTRVMAISNATMWFNIRVRYCSSKEFHCCIYDESNCEINSDRT